jgi:hypothetical protein
MRKLHWSILTLLLIASVACVPNRLDDALVTPEPGTTRVVALPAPTPDGRSLQPQLANADIDLAEVVSLLPPDAIPAILPDDVPDIMVTAAEADAAGLEPSVRVLGLEINGDSRAYPIPFMSAHEIVNDVVGGRHVAVTW